MKNFIALYYNTSGAHQPQPNLTAEQKEQMVAPWGVWAAKCGDRLVNMGAPLAPGSSSANGDTWLSSKNLVTGLLIKNKSPTVNECRTFVFDSKPKQGLKTFVLNFKN